MEPWDGPAAIARAVIAANDEMYKTFTVAITKDKMLFAGSETE